MKTDFVVEPAVHSVYVERFLFKCEDLVNENCSSV